MWPDCLRQAGFQHSHSRDLSWKLSLDRLLSTMLSIILSLQGRLVRHLGNHKHFLTLGFLASTPSINHLLSKGVVWRQQLPAISNSGHPWTVPSAVPGRISMSVTVQPSHPLYAPDPPQAHIVPRLFLLPCWSPTLTLPIFPFSGFLLPFLMCLLDSTRAEVFPGRKLLQQV